MRTRLYALLGLALAMGAGARAEEQTVSDYAEAMTAIGVRLDAEVDRRQKAGDMAAAQRLVLSSAMVRNAADEFRAAEQEKLTDPVRALPAPLPARAAEAMLVAAKAEAEAPNARGFLDEESRAYNALLAALPVQHPHPVLYGLLSRDLDPEPLPADIVVYGYRLIDPQLKAPPTVMFGKTELPAKVVDDERIDVTLPEDVKAEVHFAPSPCEPRVGFGLRVRAAYTERKGVWPLAWREELTTTSDYYTLPSPVLYVAKATASAEDAGAVSTRVSFQQSSELAVADCEQTRAVEVSAPLPPGAQNADCAGEWRNLSGATHSQSRCVVEKGVARAFGELTGGARICSPEHLCTCPNAAQGFLVVRGAYQANEPSRRVEVAPLPASLAFAAGGAAETELALGPGRRLQHVAIDIFRRDCPRAIDRVDLDLVDDAQTAARGVSKTGAFRAALTGASVRVGAAEAFAADAGKTP